MGVRLQERDKGWYVIINWQHQRRAKYFGKNKALAKEFRDKMEARLRLGHDGLPTKERVLFGDYAATWLDRIQHTRKRSTHEDYGKILRHDLLPAFRSLELNQLTREKVKALAFAGLKNGQSSKTVLNVIRCLSCLLSHAKEDGLITENTALKPGKFLPRVSKRAHINPLTRGEITVLLDSTLQRAPQYYPLLICAIWTGLRQGELLALQWEDLNLAGSFLEVQRNYTRGHLTTPKNGESRRVDLSRQLVQTLKELHVERQLEATVKGWATLPPWVFCTPAGGLLEQDTLRNTFYGLLKATGIRRVRFHDLRHTYASLLLQQGESSVYVKEQLGHKSIMVTLDLYGHLIPGGNRQAVDRLDTMLKRRGILNPSKREKFDVELVTQSGEGRFFPPPPSMDVHLAKENIEVSIGMQPRCNMSGSKE